MRRNHLAGVAAAAALTLLLVSQPGNANPQPTDAHITSPSGVVIFAVQSRDANIGTNADAVAILNTTGSPVDLDNWTLQVSDASGTTTADATFTTTLQPWQQVIVSAADYTPTPILPHANQQGFDTEATDAIADTFEVVLTDDVSAEQDRVATADNANISPEGDPALELDSSTDPFNVPLRRDVLGTDTNDNAADFSRAPILIWGLTL